MTSFELGFLKQAEEYGVAVDHASHILKRAMDHPGTQEMFKELPQDEEHSPEDMEVLQELLQQNLINEKFNGQAKQIQLP
jgi:hypothetical protein